MLLYPTLPTVEEACKYVQQEESHKEIKGVKPDPDAATMYGKGEEEGCTVCGGKRHTADKCWEVIGYPKWHSKSRGLNKGKSKESGGYVKGNRTKRPQKGKFTAAVQGEQEGTLKVGENMLMREVLCVPDFKYNVLSVSKLLKHENYKGRLEQLEKKKMESTILKKSQYKRKEENKKLMSKSRRVT
ncbi:DNA-directed RNA polymerase III subunit RPC3 [Bienertia sinuspersici]